MSKDSDNHRSNDKQTTEIIFNWPKLMIRNNDISVCAAINKCFYRNGISFYQLLSMQTTDKTFCFGCPLFFGISYRITNILPFLDEVFRQNEVKTKELILIKCFLLSYLQ